MVFNHQITNSPNREMQWMDGMMQTQWVAVRSWVRREHGQRLPRWASVADGLSLLILVLLAARLLWGPIRLHAGGLHLSVSSVARLVSWLTVIAGGRHLLIPRPMLPERLYAGAVTTWRSRAVRATLPVALSTRLSVLLVGYLAVVTIGYPGAEPPLRVSASEVWNLPLRWDAGWYLDVATVGYRWSNDSQTQQNVAFFPAYPLLIRTAAALVGARPPVGDFEPLNRRHLAVGLGISLAAFWGALLYLYALARDRLGGSAAASAVLLLAAYPFALFFSAVYTESLMLLGCVATFHHSHRSEWTAAALWGLLVGLTRPNGFLLSVPVAVLSWNWLRSQGTVAAGGLKHSGLLRATLAVAAPVAGLLVYCAFLYVWIGRPLAWLEAHAAWGRTYTGFGGLVILPRELSSSVGLDVFARARAIDGLNAMAAALALASVWPVTRRLGLAYGLFMLANIVPPLAFGGLLSIGRTTSVLFPMFVYLAVALPSPSRLPVACGFACLQGLSAALFYTWRPLL